MTLDDTLCNDTSLPTCCLSTNPFVGCPLPRLALPLSKLSRHSLPPRTSDVCKSTAQSYVEELDPIFNSTARKSTRIEAAELSVPSLPYASSRRIVGRCASGAGAHNLHKLWQTDTLYGTKHSEINSCNLYWIYHIMVPVGSSSSRKLPSSHNVGPGKARDERTRCLAHGRRCRPVRVSQQHCRVGGRG